MYEKLGINDNVVELINECEKDCYEEFKKMWSISEITKL